MAAPLPPTSQPNLLSQWSDADYWRKLCPYLTISDDDTTTNQQEVNEDDSTRKLLQTRLIDDGYALIDAGIEDVLRKTLCRGISDMETIHFLPATFLLLFDETWQLAMASHNLLLSEKQGILHHHHNSMAFNFDMLAWHIDPRRNQSGFSPHRDRQPDTMSALEQSFYPDGQSKYTTHWIALSDATPENSCLYVIPKQFDPGYLKGDDSLDNEENGKDQSDPLARALNTKQAYQNIRALPRKAGQSLVFTHRIMHWGSRGNPNALNVQPRIAISFVYSDVKFEAPYISTESFSRDTAGNWSFPSFSTRLLLVCAQLLIYYQRFDLPTSSLRACYDYCKTRANQLEDNYRKKVFVEYVKAMKERRDGIAGEGDSKKDESSGVHNDDGSECANSDDEDAMLEEMLNNSGEYEDDYDDICDSYDVSESQHKKRKHSK